jgi:hypothetical protein
MLAYCLAIAVRSCGVSPWPKSRSNSFRGSDSMGSGVVGVLNEMVAP